MLFNVMVVDDSPAMRRFIRRVIAISGFPVDRFLEASHGVHALAELARYPVDVVLTDINMPEMDGEALVGEMRRHHEWQSLPVIVVSTDATDARIERLMELGAQGYVTKPFAPERLRGELERVLGVFAGSGGSDDLGF
ncbi:response regulator [Bryobacter aggregatus]|uniref:response regulator n=1 Tax=Bryobacter aggregatus TaxID=360054 RepID=UPI0004E11157|nr:response regulator [Bryobacter aggregatus]